MKTADPMDSPEIYGAWLAEYYFDEPESLDVIRENSGDNAVLMFIGALIARRFPWSNDDNGTVSSILFWGGVESYIARLQELQAGDE